MIEVLSENGDLKPMIKEAENMLTRVDVTKLPSYELGLEAGCADGMAKGLEKGRMLIARRLLAHSTEDEVAAMTELSVDQVHQLREAEPE